MTPSDRLIERAKNCGATQLGIGQADISRIPISQEVIDEIVQCLSSRDANEIKWGLWFANGILDSNPPQAFLKWLKPRIPDWMEHEKWDVRNQAMEIFVRLRDNYPDFRNMMLKRLGDESPSVRWDALKAHRAFIRRENIKNLLAFQNDPYMSETEMGSPLVYPLRNLALSIIEELCLKQFAKSERVEQGEGGRLVYWWDWQPFLDWWKRRSILSRIGF